MKQIDKHLRAFWVRYIGPTCFKGARVVVHDQRNNVRRYLPYDYALGDILDQGWAFLESKGIQPEFYCEVHKGGHHILTSNFTTQILGTKHDTP